MGIPKRLGDRLRPILALGLAAVFVLAACGGSTAILSNVGGPIPGASGAAAEPGFDGQQAAPTAAPALAPGEQGQGGSGSSGGTPPNDQLDNNLKIVYTGSLQLVVADLQQAIAQGRTAVMAVGGYIGASQESNDGDKSVATISYRIPAGRWEETLVKLRGFGTKVVAEQTQATEVGSQIVDLEARIRNLRASESALVEIAKGAGKISDLLQVEAQLTDIRGQIEQLDAQRTQLNDQVAYGTLVTTYGLELVAVQEKAKGWDPAQDVDGATATLIGIGQSVVSFGIWFGIVWLPLLVLLVVLAVVVRVAARRLLPKPRPQGPIPGWGQGGQGGQGGEGAEGGAG